MSLYNTINGYNLAVFFIAPLLGVHPEEWPRFRDCFSDGKEIEILTRTGDEEEWDNKMIYEHPDFKEKRPFIQKIGDQEVKDETFALWAFRIPEKWQEDFKFVHEREFTNVSQEYQDLIKETYPKAYLVIQSIFHDS